MRGEGTCREKPDDGTHSHGEHCIHLLCDGSDELVCCWCGDLFINDDEPEPGAHGEYMPKRKEPPPEGSGSQSSDTPVVG